MKKLSAFIAFGLLVSLAFFSSGKSYAGTISVPTFSADSGVTHLETLRTTVVSVINGNIEGSGSTGATSNIKADSLGELDMADEVNPRVRANELLGVGVDTTSAQASFIYTGLTPATSATLTSDISFGTAYINGYRVPKTATSNTYTASMDTYVDLSQTGTYTFSAVAVGATAPSVAANSARLAKVTTSGTAITAVTDLANRRIPGLIVPAHYRTGFSVSRDSTTGISVYPGSAEVNNAMLSKTAITTLGLGTAGDWAGGSSLRASNTSAYVGIDASGNIKLHTTAPTHDNYGVSTTSGKKRYATWSSTVYRILGWFRMNGTGSGEVELVGNIREGDAANSIVSSDNTSTSTASTTMVPMYGMVARGFYTSGGPVLIEWEGNVDSSVSTEDIYAAISVDSGAVGPIMKHCADSSDSGEMLQVSWQQVYSQGTHDFEIKWRTDSGTATQNGVKETRAIRVTEK